MIGDDLHLIEDVCCAGIFSRPYIKVFIAAPNLKLELFYVIYGLRTVMLSDEIHAQGMLLLPMNYALASNVTFVSC